MSYFKRNELGLVESVVLNRRGDIEYKGFFIRPAVEDRALNWPAADGFRVWTDDGYGLATPDVFPTVEACKKYIDGRRRS